MSSPTKDPNLAPTLLPAPRSDSTQQAEHQAAASAARRPALVAGAAIMLVAVLAGFGNLVVVQGLVTPGDAPATAHDITASEGLFRLGVASLYLAALLDIVVAWALFTVFRPVHSELSRLSAWLRLAYAVVFIVALSQLAGIPALLNGADGTGPFTRSQLQAQALAKADAFHNIWSAGLILFGAHLVGIGILAYRSGFVPRLIGALLVLAGAGYAFDSLVSVFTEHPVFVVSNVTFLGEFLLGVWLLKRGRHTTRATKVGCLRLRDEWWPGTSNGPTEATNETHGRPARLRPRLPQTHQVLRQIAARGWRVSVPGYTLDQKSQTRRETGCGWHARYVSDPSIPFVHERATDPVLLRTMSAAGLPAAGGFVSKAGWVSRAWIGDDYVVRVNHDPRFRDAYRHEAAVVNLLAGSEVPHARHIAHGDGPDGPWYVSERLPGQTLYDAWPAADSSTRQAIIESLGAVLRALHRVPVPADLLPPWLAGALSGKPWPAFHPPVVSAALQQVEAARRVPGHDSQLLADVTDWIQERLVLFVDDEPVLVHGDLHGSNVMVDQRRVTGMIDFAEALAQPADVELDTILRWCAKAREFPPTPDEQGLDETTLTEVPGWLHGAYPELFEREHLRERLDLYDMFGEVTLYAHHPEADSRDATQDRIVRLLSGHNHLDGLVW
jgi:aminoglycoside phosphotransferase (APT) family kinase protein